MKTIIEKQIAESILIKNELLKDELLKNNIVIVVNACIEAFERGNKVILAGNGGSAADAQHIAAEFVSRFEYDRPGLPALALTTDTSMLTAIGNDYGYENLFKRQIEANGRKGDIFIGISTSGNSPNVLKAFEVCQSNGIFAVGLAGRAGKIHELSDICISVPSEHTPRIQECHILIGHIICGLIENILFSEYKNRE